MEIVVNRKRKPDLVVIGAQKAGTTWLYNAFRQHDHIWVPPFKEIHFFDHKFCPDRQGWTSRYLDKHAKAARIAHIQSAKRIDRDYLLYLEAISGYPRFNGNWYQDIFARAPDDQITADITPGYFGLSSEAIAFVHKFLPRTKFLCLVRDPVARALSAARMALAKRAIRPSSQQEWRQFVDDALLIANSDYAKQIPKWDAHFGARMRYLPFDCIVNEPKTALALIEAHMGLPSCEIDFEALDKHATDPSITIPDWLADEIEETLMPQTKFLTARFGPRFQELPTLQELPTANAEVRSAS